MRKPARRRRLILVPLLLVAFWALVIVNWVEDRSGGANNLSWAIFCVIGLACTLGLVEYADSGFLKRIWARRPR